MGMARRQVFYQTDERGATLVSISIHSLLKESDPNIPIAIYVAHNTRFSQANCQDQIRKVVSRFAHATVKFADFDPVFDKYRSDLFIKNVWWSSPIYAYCFFPELFPEIHGNLLYIDWDTLVTCDLEELFSMDLTTDGSVLAAVDEAPREEHVRLEPDWPAEAGNYFNNGVMVIDSEAWRRENASDRIRIWYGKNRHRCRLIEQDATNVILGSKTRHIPPKWNYCDNWLRRFRKFAPWSKCWYVYKPQDILEAILNPRIIHFYGGKKPNIFTHRPERRRFYRVMKELGLYHRPLPGETFLGHVEGVLFDIQHFLLRTYARILHLFI